MQSFTHVDPFEDTERGLRYRKFLQANERVSPTSIRSRILKDGYTPWPETAPRVSPTSIRSRILKGSR